MIISQNSEIKIMEVLVRYWYKEFSAYELAEDAKVSAPMVYKIIERLVSLGIAAKKDKKFKINFNSLISYNFKRFYDAERMSELPKETQYKISNIFKVYLNEYKNNLLGFIIFGSVASNETVEESDIDMMAIVSKKKEMDYRKKGLLNMGKINIIEKTIHEFENDYLLANDLILNALMNGILLFDNGGVAQFFMTKPLPQPSNEVILQKKERLETLHRRMFDLLKDKDYKSLVEQYKEYLIEKGRIFALESGVIPSSKKNILSILKKKDKKIYLLYQKANEKNILEVIKNV